MALCDGRVIEPVAGHDARAEVLHDHVGVGDEFLQSIAPFVGAGIDDQ